MQLLSALRISSACSWSTQKTMVLPKRSVFFRKSVRFLAIASVRAFSDNEPLEILGAVVSVRDLPAVAVNFALGGPPARRVHSGDDAVHAIRREESVIDALPQAVGVERIAEIRVRVAVVLPQRRRRHAELECRLEVLQDLAPVAFVPGAAAMALVHDDEVEEVAREFPDRARAGCSSLRDGLIGREIHLAALDRLALDLPARVAERREMSCPSGRPRGCCGRRDTESAGGDAPRSGSSANSKLPADLKCDDRLAGAGGKRQEDTRSCPGGWPAPRG